MIVTKYRTGVPQPNLISYGKLTKLLNIEAGGEKESGIGTLSEGSGRSVNDRHADCPRTCSFSNPQIISSGTALSSVATTAEGGYGGAQRLHSGAQTAQMLQRNGAKVGEVIQKLDLHAVDLSSLTAVDLTNRGVKARDVMALSPLLRVSTTLRSLKLGYNNLQDDGAYAVAAALECQASLLALDLGFNSIGDTGAAALGRSLVVNSTLRTLCLSGNTIGPAGAESMASGLGRNATLEVLHLTGNSLGGGGASMLSNALFSNSTLRKVYMSGSSIGRIGAEALAAALRGLSPTNDGSLSAPVRSISSLSTATPMGDGSEATAHATTSSATCFPMIGRIGLDDENGDDDFSSQSLIDKSYSSRSPCGLECVYISDNDIGDKGVAAIATAMQTHRSLKILELGCVPRKHHVHFLLSSFPEEPPP